MGEGRGGAVSSAPPAVVASSRATLCRGRALVYGEDSSSLSRDDRAVDGVHDLGGMHGFGPVPIEADEPLFHERWEGRVWRMLAA